MENAILEKIHDLKKEGEEIAKEIINNNLSCGLYNPLVSYRNIGKLSSPSHPFSKEFEEDKYFNNALKYTFQHFQANPSNHEKSKLILDTYVKKGKIFNELTEFISANDENGINPTFWKEVEMSLLKIMNKGKVNREDLFSYIIGPKGCGKTTFINYFITEKENCLNEKYKTITIRINATNLLNDITISQGIKYKICKILFNYYCSDSEKSNKNKCFFSLKDVCNYTHNIFDFVDNFFNEFIGENNDKIGSIPHEYTSIFNKFLNFIKNKCGYSFLIIIDNLDQLSIRPNDVDNYNKRIEQVSKYIMDDDSHLGTHIIIMRHNTYFELPKLKKIGHTPFAVRTPTFHDIYDLRKNSLNFQPNDTFQTKEELLNYLDTYVRIVGSSFKKQEQEEAYLSLTDALQNIEELCSFNKRQAVSLMTLFPKCSFKGIRITQYLTDILNNEFNKNSNTKSLVETLHRGHYRLFESLMINSRGHCCCYNEYTLNKKGKLEFTNLIDSEMDSRFFPNLFKYPSCHGTKGVFSPFLKIRILQLLKNLDEEDLSIREISTVLRSIFGYKIDAIELACRELLDGCCLTPVNSNLDINTVSNYSVLKIAITQRGILILNNLPIRVNYLAVCYEDVNFPKKLIGINNNRINIPIGNYFFVDSSIFPFLIENILYSTPKIIGLLKRIQLYEAGRYYKYMESPHSLKKLFESSDFKVIESLERDADSTYRKIVSSYLIQKKERIDYYEKLFDKKN